MKWGWLTVCQSGKVHRGWGRALSRTRIAARDRRSIIGLNGLSRGIHTTHLFAYEVRMSANTPKTFGDEPALGIEFRPVTVRKRPGVLQLGTAFEILVGPLLIVGDELGQNRCDSNCEESDVGCGWRGARLECGCVGREAG